MTIKTMNKYENNTAYLCASYYICNILWRQNRHLYQKMFALSSLILFRAALFLLAVRSQLHFLQ